MYTCVYNIYIYIYTYVCVDHGDTLAASSKCSDTKRRPSEFITRKDQVSERARSLLIS